MKVAALLAGGVTLAVAQAQSDGARIELLPMPKTLPQVFFAPDSLAGPMLEPLALPQTPAAAPAAQEEDLVAAEPEAAEQAETHTGTLAQAESEPSAEPIPEETAAAQPEAAEPEPAAATPAATTVHVIVENVESSDGTVNVAVCDTDFSPEGCPYKLSVPASAGFVEAMFDDVPPGVYAVVGYHDVNNNDEFDKFLGVPREPYALSGLAAQKLVPQFSDAVLNINQGENYVIIRMQRLGNG